MIADAAGWYGKIPAKGDFVGSGLPREFVGPWDDWLQRALVDSRQVLEQRFDELYLTFPIWRFLLAPGLAGASGWCGVLSPSVDRVGRCFPLTIAQPLPAARFDSAPLAAIDRHLDAFARQALDAVDGAPADDFGMAVAALPAAPHDDAPDAALRLDGFGLPGQPDRWRLRESLGSWLPRSANHELLQRLSGRMLWWTPCSGEHDGLLRLATFPPADRLLSELISA